MVEFIRKFPTTLGILISSLVFLSIGLLFKGQGFTENNSQLLSASSFLFGIFVAFSIANNHSKLSKVNETLKEDEAILLSVYELSSSFGENVKNKVRNLIDNYLIDQIDYYLWDFKYSYKTFIALHRFLNTLEAKTKTQEAPRIHILGLMSESFKNRKVVETYSQEKMWTFEWTSILILLGLIIFIVLKSNDGTYTSIILSTLLLSSAIILVFVLRDLNNLRWKEKTLIWEPLDNLFHALDLLPYYPKGIVKSKRAKIKKGEKIRLASYPDPYPDMTHKKVEIVVYGK